MSDDERRGRLAVRHALAPSARVATVEAAVEAMTCLHATEPANVYLSAHARSGATRDDIERALFHERTVVRQLAMRRTVFAFPRDLLPAVWGSASARVAAQLGARLAKEVEAAGLAPDGPAWLREVCAAVLAELAAAPATTTMLRERIPMLDVRLQISPGKSYGGEFPVAPRVLSTLAADGVVLRGRNDGGWKTTRPYWTLASEWLGEEVTALDERAGYAALRGELAAHVRSGHRGRRGVVARRDQGRGPPRAQPTSRRSRWSSPTAPRPGCCPTTWTR